MQKQLSIALVDDHKILLDGVEALLLAHGDYEIVLKVDSAEQILNYGSLGEIDLLIMDIKMSGMDGIQAIAKLKEKGYQGKCIFLSSYDDLKLVNEAIAAGALGYMTKSNAHKHLYEAIEHVTQDKVFYSPDIKERILKAFTKTDNKNIELPAEKAFLRQLTKREVEVLTLIAQQYTSEEIAQKLYIARGTVDTHRKNLISKLQVKNSIGLGLFAERNGLI